MKIENFNNVKNQFIIRDNEGNTFFQSYDSIIVKKDKEGKIFLDSDNWDYSKTTGKYRNLFLGESIKETREKIKNSLYTLVNLN